MSGSVPNADAAAGTTPSALAENDVNRHALAGRRHSGRPAGARWLAAPRPTAHDRARLERLCEAEGIEAAIALVNALEAVRGELDVEAPAPLIPLALDRARVMLSTLEVLPTPKQASAFAHLDTSLSPVLLELRLLMTDSLVRLTRGYDVEALLVASTRPLGLLDAEQTVIVSSFMASSHYLALDDSHTLCGLDLSAFDMRWRSRSIVDSVEDASCAHCSRRVERGVMPLKEPADSWDFITRATARTREHLDRQCELVETSLEMTRTSLDAGQPALAELDLANLVPRQLLARTYTTIAERVVPLLRNALLVEVRTTFTEQLWTLVEDSLCGRSAPDAGARIAAGMLAFPR